MSESQTRQLDPGFLFEVAEQYNDEVDRRMIDGVVDVLSESVERVLGHYVSGYDSGMADVSEEEYDVWQDRLVFATCLPSVVGFLKAHPEFKVEFADLLGQLREALA